MCCWDPDTRDFYPHSFYMWEVPENEMQRSGRLHNYKDFRSAAHAYQRTRKYPRTKRSRKADRIPGFWGYERNGRRTNMNEETRHHLERREWADEYHYDSVFQWRLSHMTGYHHFEKYGTWGDARVIGEGEEGEDFGMWARRRIEEMRRVKEDRIRRQQEALREREEYTPQDPATIPTPHECLQAQSKQQHLLSKPIPSTTLPTNSYDIYGHSLLTSLLSPTSYPIKQLIRRGKPPFPSITTYAWFDEFTFAWHRNLSGCWEFGRASCEGGAIPCQCCQCPRYECSCKEWEGKVGPEEVQRCALVEWVRGELRRVLEEEERRGRECVRGFEIVKESQVEEDMWEVMSDAVSCGWSVIGEEEEFVVI